MRKEYDYIIVGAGLCGLALAKDLVQRKKRVLILEKGRFLNRIGTIPRALLFYEGHGLAYSRQRVNIYRINAVGGTSIVACGNAVTPSDEEIRKTGIDFTAELPAVKKESFVHDEGLVIGRASRRIMDEANKLNYPMQPMPKFSITGKCTACGNCVLGCAYGSKWTARHYLSEMDKDYYDLITDFCVDKVISENGRAVGVKGRKGLMFATYLAPKVILAAGGINTPIILQKSNLDAGDNLFVDLFTITYGANKEYRQIKELTMSVVCGKFHRDEGFVFAPFVDCWYSFANSVPLQHFGKVFSLNRLMGIMVKINDDATGKVYPNGRVDKTPTESDWKKLRRGEGIAKEILLKCGVDPKSIFVTRPSGAHPGGTAAIGKIVDTNLETRLKDLYVCDASVLPFAPGLPPVLILLALSKWFGKRI